MRLPIPRNLHMKRIGPQLAAAEIVSGLTIHTTVQDPPGVDLRLAVRQSRLRSGEREPGGGRVGVYAAGGWIGLVQWPGRFGPGSLGTGPRPTVSSNSLNITQRASPSGHAGRYSSCY